MYGLISGSIFWGKKTCKELPKPLQPNTLSHPTSPELLLWPRGEAIIYMQGTIIFDRCNGLRRPDEIYLVFIAPRGSVLLHKTNNPVAVLYWLNCSSLARCGATSSQNTSHQGSNVLLGSCTKWDHKSAAFISHLKNKRPNTIPNHYSN